MASVSVTRQSSFLLSVAWLLERQPVGLLEKAAQTILDGSRIGGTVFTCGNGGSAANALHFSSDLQTGGRRERQVRSVCLNANLAVLSAISNDFGFDEVFSYQLRPLICSQDILVLFSVSGTSPNVLAAAEVAQTKGATVICFTRDCDSKLALKSDIVFSAPDDNFGVVESAHLCIAHAVADIVSGEAFKHQ